MKHHDITRHFATVTSGRWGPRQVHYRRVGSGPVVICFHQSPLSSRDMIPTMLRWKDHFTCIAPDSPGFGLSDPLGVPYAEMGDFAEAVIEFMDALGIEHAAVYGFHTGAMISGAIAAAYPDRIVCAAANGYVVMTEPEKQDIVAHYLPPLSPSWDGAHLTWLWARMREQLIFFPWYRKSLATRMNSDVPPPEALHAGVLDFLRSGDHYRVGYRAAFTMRSDLALKKAKVPTLVTAADTDVLSQQLARIRHTASCVTVRTGGTMEQTLELCRDFISKHKPPKGPKIASPSSLPCRLRQDYADFSGGQLRLRRNDDATGRAVLVLHDAIGSSETVVAVSGGFIGKRPVIALNLPGHGESDSIPGRGKFSLSNQARMVLQALDALDIHEVDCLGFGMGGMVGLEASLLAPSQIRHLAMASVIYPDTREKKRLRAHGIPDIQPNWFGGHLLEAWHFVRDQALFSPWFDRTRQAILRQELRIDPDRVNRRVFELFRSYGTWRKAMEAELDYPFARQLARTKVPKLFCAPQWDPRFGSTRRLADEARSTPFVALPDAEEQWADTLLPFFDR